MISSNDITRIESSTVYDNDGDKVGKVGQIYLDDHSGDPSWITVSTGFFGTSETFVPVEGARFDGDDLHVAYDKDKIKGAPHMEVDQHLSETEEAELYRYYGLQYGGADYQTGTADVTADHTHTDTTRTTGDAAMTVSEERLEVGKESREAGRARLRKYTTTETETVNVPVTKEKLVVERNPVSGEHTSAGPISDTDDVEEITLREERAVVDKETVPVEEVRVGKEQVTEHESVTADVRKEHVDVDGATETDGGDVRR
jgi:uncharacterized protein (TIGR02271 family)